MASLPVVLEHKALGAEAEDPAHARQAGVRAASVVVAAGTLRGALARMVVGVEPRPGPTIARALVAALEVAARILARTPAAVHLALVDICKQHRNFKSFHNFAVAQLHYSQYPGEKRCDSVTNKSIYRIQRKLQITPIR